MKGKNPKLKSRRTAYTLVELLVASSLSLMILAGAVALFTYVFRSWQGVELRMETDRDVNRAMAHIIYGVDGRLGLRAADGVSITSNALGWTLTYGTGQISPQTNRLVYSKTTKTLVFNPGEHQVGSDITYAFVSPSTASMTVTLRVERVKGVLKAKREVGTTVSFRNL